MKLLLLTTVLTTLLALALARTQARGLPSNTDDYCFGKDKDRSQTRHFTSKTAYQIIKGTNIEKQYLVPGCEPKKIWILHRHGTRLPTKSTIQKAPRLDQLRDEIVTNYRVRRTNPVTNALCQEDLIALQMWRWNASITEDREQFLTSQGYEDLRGTAKLYQKYYPDVLPKEYDSSTYLFRHTDTQRTTESFKAFAEGLFGNNNEATPQDIPERDLLLRPYDYCESWRAHDYTSAGSENYKFKLSKLWKKTILAISVRLGFVYPMESSDVQLMFDMCRYDQAWQVDRTSAWCAAFTPEQISVLEYEDDLHYYYKLGYGYDENSRLNCRAVQDMLTHLDSASNPKVVAYFAHSSGVQTLITALGINKDDIPLTAGNYNNMTERRWKTSNIDPFAANFVAVKYECSSDSVNPEKVIFFLNQNAVDLDWCNVGLCNWSEVMKRYDNFYHANCDEYYCRSGTGAMASSLLTLLFAVIVYLTY